MRKKTCYTYTRVSTAVQIEGFSLEAQDVRLKEYAEYKDLDIVGSYCDAGKSGKNIKGRPEFQRMLDDIVSQKDDVSYVLVFKLSRFGRNAADIMKSLQLLMDFGVDLVCVEDAIDSSTQGGRLTLSILSAVAEIERENISVQFMSGRLQRLKEGKWPGGPAPYGYRIGTDGLVADPSEAEIVKQIYSLYLQDEMRVNSVATWLNQNGYTRFVNGKMETFTRDMVSMILSNPMYCGKLFYNRRSAKKDVIEIEGQHEAFVTVEQWNAVQDKREKIRRIYARTENLDRISLLSGLIRCPVCGTGMVYVKSHKTNPNHGGYYKTVYGYACRRHVRSNLGGRCAFSRQFNQEKVDSAVFEIICGLTTTAAFRDAVIKQFGSQKDEEELEEEIKTIRRRLRGLVIQKKKLGEDLDKLDIFDDDYDRNYDAIQEKIDEAYNEIDAMEKSLDQMSRKKETLHQGIRGGDRIHEMLEHIQRLYEHMSCAQRKEMYRLLIEKIEVFPEHPEGKIIRSVSFRIPVFYDEEDAETIMYMERTPDERVIFTLDCSDREPTAAEAKATYAQISAYIREKYNTRVTNLYIAQVKRKYGLDMRPNFNISKKPDAKVVQCSPAKEAMIVEALQHFRMLAPEAKPVMEDGNADEM